MKKDDSKDNIIISFDNKIGNYYSMQKAVILKELRFWNENKAKNKALKHKLPLVYYSARALSEKIECVSLSSTKRFLKELVQDGILFDCIANKMQRDITKSYLVNIEKYEAIKNKRTYSDSDNELFNTLCKAAVLENAYNDNSEIDSNLVRFLNVQLRHSKDKTALNVQKLTSNVQLEPTLPSNTPSKKELINSEISDKELKTIKLMIDIFKNYFSEVRINKNSYNLLLKIYNQVGNDLRTYKQSKKQSSNIMQKDVLEVLVSILIVLNKRITDKKKRNLGYLKTAIQNEAIENHIKHSKVDLLSHLDSKQIATHNKNVLDKGEAYAIGVTKRYLMKKGKIKQEINN